MLKWLFGRRAAKVRALEHYLSHFDAGELAHLKNLTLIGLMPTSSVPLGTMSVSATIDLATYIHAEWMATQGLIPNTPAGQASVRFGYRAHLAKDMTSLVPRKASDFFRAISPHRLEEPMFTPEQEERLGSHSIMLERIYADPLNAPSLPELEALDEGRAWRFAN